MPSKATAGLDSRERPRSRSRSRRVEHGARRADARAVDVVAEPRASVAPGDEVVRAVEGDRGRGLVARRRRDRDPGRVEHRSGRAHARAVDVGRAGAVVVPDDEVVRPVEGERGGLLELGAGPETTCSETGYSGLMSRSSVSG